MLPKEAVITQSSVKPLLLVGYFPKLKAQYPAASGEPWRLPFSTANPRLKKYLARDALVLRTGTSVEVSSDAVPFSCPGKFDFDLGLLPIE